MRRRAAGPMAPASSADRVTATDRLVRCTAAAYGGSAGGARRLPGLMTRGPIGHIMRANTWTGAAEQPLHFLKAFLNDPGAIGAISPSSQVLALAMVDNLDPQPGHGVLELGPGTGAFTAEIRRRLASPDDYVGVERDPGFARVLRERFPDLRIVNGLAEDIGEFYERNALPAPKAILCGLPFSIQRRATLDSIVAMNFRNSRAASLSVYSAARSPAINAGAASPVGGR